MGAATPALAAARLGCIVTGIDYVPALLERGRERAAAERLSLDLREGSMFAPDHRRAAAELVRVTRVVGTIPLASWTPDGFVGAMFGTAAKHVAPPAGLASPMLWSTERRLAGLFGRDVLWAHRRRTFTFRFASADAFVACFAAYYGPTLKALEAAGSGRDALERELKQLALSWNRLGQPSPIAVPAAYLESVGIRR